MHFDKKALIENGMIVLGASGGMIASNQMLDFTKIFKDMYAKNPESFLFKHQGGIKAAAGITAIAMFGKKMPPLVKYALLGVTMQGAIQEIRSLTMKDGVSPLQQIGAGADMSELDRLLKEAAGMQGTNPTTEFPTSVAGAQGNDLKSNATTAVAGWDSMDGEDF